MNAYTGKKKWNGKAIALALVLLAAAVMLLCGVHWAASAPGGDWEALGEGASSYFSGSGDYRGGALQIVKTAEEGDYLAALGTGEDGAVYLCVFHRDRLLPGRWHAQGGTLETDMGQMGSWNFSSPQSGAVVVFFGVGLPEEARWYTFQNSGVICTVPVECDTVLDLMVIPNGTDASSFPRLLDENWQEIR